MTDKQSSILISATLHSTSVIALIFSLIIGSLGVDLRMFVL